MARLRPVIGPNDFYLQVYEPLTGLRRRGLLRRWSADHAVVGGMLTEDLASVWADLRPGLALFGGVNEDDALFDWHVGYESHWGLHAVSALYVFTHSLYF